MSYPTDCTEQFTTVIHHEGFSFEFSGKWIPAVPATREEPGDGGYFVDYLVELNGKPIEKILNENTINAIISRAIEEKSRE